MNPYVLYDFVGKITVSSYQPNGVDIVIPPDLSLLYTNTYIEYVNDYYVQDGVLHKKPTKVNEFDEWNYEQQAWQSSYETASKQVLDERLRLLEESDWTALVGAEERLGTEVFNQWQTYRQALRDITDQSGYPFNVNFPVAPN